MLNLYKEIGETPLERIERFRASNPSYKGVKLSYAGRLDPMAEGVLLVMEGEENKEREKYLGFDKDYVAEILFGVETDTFDVLGVVMKYKEGLVPQERIEKNIKDMPKTFDQEYPPYSSKTIGGIPLFALTRKGLAHVLPKRSVSLKNIEVVGFRSVDSLELLMDIERRIGLVRGDFRQIEILARWREVLSTSHAFSVAKLSLSCSSGFYVRTLAHTLGKDLGTGAFALSIKRTQAGAFKIEDSAR